MAAHNFLLQPLEALVNEVTEEMPDNDPRKMEYCLLSNLVADYSDEHFDLGTPTLQECLKERMFEQGLSQKDVAGILTYHRLWFLVFNRSQSQLFRRHNLFHPSRRMNEMT